MDDHYMEEEESSLGERQLKETEQHKAKRGP